MKKAVFEYFPLKIWERRNIKNLHTSKFMVIKGFKTLLRIKHQHFYGTCNSTATITIDLASTPSTPKKHMIYVLVLHIIFKKKK